MYVDLMDISVLDESVTDVLEEMIMNGETLEALDDDDENDVDDDRHLLNHSIL